MNIVKHYEKSILAITRFSEFDTVLSNIEKINYKNYKRKIIVVFENNKTVPNSINDTLIEVLHYPTNRMIDNHLILFRVARLYKLKKVLYFSNFEQNINRPLSNIIRYKSIEEKKVIEINMSKLQKIMGKQMDIINRLKHMF